MQDNMRCRTGAANVETSTGFKDALDQDLCFGDYIFVKGWVYQLIQCKEPVIKENGFPDYTAAVNCIALSSHAFPKEVKFWQLTSKTMLQLTCSQIKLFNKLNK